MPFKHYIRSIEGKTQTIKKLHEKPTWFDSRHVAKIRSSYFSCITWFTWSITPQGYKYWEQYGGLTYDQLPNEPREIIDSWIAQVNG